MTDAVWVVRHGQRQDSVDPNWARNAERVHDPGLTDLGRWAAWRTGQRLAADELVDFDAVLASPFLRTVETADEICRELGTNTYLEPGLGEHRNDEWFEEDPETLPREQLADWFGTVTLGHEPLVVPDFPETHAEAMDRVGRATRRILDSFDGTILLVGHGLTVGGVVRELVGDTDGVDAPLCGLTRVERKDDGDGSGDGDDNHDRNGDRDRWRLDFSGVTSHLDD